MNELQNGIAFLVNKQSLPEKYREYILIKKNIAK